MVGRVEKEAKKKVEKKVEKKVNRKGYFVQLALQRENNQ